MEEEKPRKEFVNRNIAIVLGAVCIALAVGMVAVCLYQGNIINEKVSLYDAVYRYAHA
jgi:hypothetical protein